MIDFKRVSSVVVFIFIMSTTLNAQVKAPEISGAFGIILGSEYPAPKPDKPYFESDSKYYLFEPPKKLRKFDTYYFGVTPKSRKVDVITAHAWFSSSTKCTREKDVIISILENKYGLFTPDDDIKYLLSYIAKGDDYIFVYCDRFHNENSKIYLKITYTNTSLGAISKKERLELEREGTDTSDL